MDSRPTLVKPQRTSLGHSPTRQKIVAADDILAQITPTTAMEALMAPSGAVKGCMDYASQAEREFAMRTAIASQRICEWLDDLTSWSWPEDGGDAGFLPVNGVIANTKRKLFGADSSSAAHGRQYMGCLLAQDVARYLYRIDEIQHGLDDLDLEDIKAHILTHHILPVSRPSTPRSDRSRSLVASFTRMDDLSAIVTAIVVQSLPNLAKLSALVHVWTMRLAVLPRIPPMLKSVQEAETALKAAWDAVTSFAEDLAKYNEANGQIDWQPSLTMESFTVIKKNLTSMVALPGKTLDYMLDCLEGTDDTLPDEWLERMEAVEQSYIELVAVGERKIREADWAKNLVRVPVARKTMTAVAEPADEVDALGIEQPATPGVSPATHEWLLDEETFDGTMSPVREEEDEEEPALPPLHDSERLDGDDLVNDTVLYGASSHFGGISSDMPEVSNSPTGLKGPVRTLQDLDNSPPSSPPMLDHSETPMMLLDSPSFSSTADYDDTVFTKSPVDESFTEDFDDSYSVPDISMDKLRRESVGEQHLRQQLSQIISSIPAKIRLTSEPAKEINLNPPDLVLPKLKKRSSREPVRRTTSAMSSRTATPSFTLSPAKGVRPRHQRGQQEIRVYHLSRSTGEAPIKLFIRCVGENGERVMVRVGGGWADLSEYLKEYATHHGRRSGRADDTTVEIRDLPQNGASRASKEPGSSPPSRPGSSLSQAAPSTPLGVRKTRKTSGPLGSDFPRLHPKTPAHLQHERETTPASEGSVRSRSDSWTEEDSSFLGLAGPSSKRVTMSEESKAWVETVKQKVRQASGEVRPPSAQETGRFGDLGRVGGTKRLFRKAGELKK